MHTAQGIPFQVFPGNGCLSFWFCRASLHNVGSPHDRSFRGGAQPVYAQVRDGKVGKTEKAGRHNPVSVEVPNCLSVENSGRQWMCVYLAPRWRRRSMALLVLVLALVLLTADARTLRRLNSGSGSAAVEKVEAGQVTSRHQKFVSFKSLVQTTAAPSADEANESERSLDASKPSSASTMTDEKTLTPEVSNSSGDNSHSQQQSETETGDTKQEDGNDHEGALDSADSADSGSDSKSYSKTTGITKKTAISPPTLTPKPVSTLTQKPTSTPTPVPTPTPTLISAKESYGPPLQPGSLHVTPQLSWSTSGSSEQSVTGQSYDSTTSAEALEKQTKSAAAITASRSIDQTLVVVIVGVVGAIGALLMFVSRKVLKETGDKDLEDSSIF